MATGTSYHRTDKRDAMFFDLIVNLGYKSQAAYIEMSLTQPVHASTIERQYSPLYTGYRALHLSRINKDFVVDSICDFDSAMRYLAKNDTEDEVVAVTDTVDPTDGVAEAILTEFNIGKK